MVYRRVCKVNHSKVLVTGGAGYIGSHAVASLLSSSRHVVVVDKDKEACENLLKIFQNNKNLTVHCTDIDNDVWMDGILENEKPTACFHFAGYSSIQESIKDPLKYYNNNTAKTINLLKRLNRNGVHRFIFASTAAVYGNPESPQSITEITPCKPINAYGNSNLMIEFILKQMFDTIPAFEYTSFRIFNVAGCHLSGKIFDSNWKNKENIFCKFMTGILNQEGRIEVYGVDYPSKDGTAVRDYIHPEDVISAMMIALDNDIKGVYNLGSEEPSSVWDVVEKFVSVTDRELDVIHKNRRNGDLPVLCADTKEWRTVSGWEPAYTLKDMVATTWKTYGV